MRVCGIVCVFYLAVVRSVRCSDRSSGIGYLVNVILIVVSGVIGWINCVKRGDPTNSDLTHSDKKSSSVKKETNWSNQKIFIYAIIIDKERENIKINNWKSLLV